MNIEENTIRILIVDDERSIRESLDEFLSDYGYAIVTADSGESALEINHGDVCQFDLAIVDLRLPGIGGEALIMSLKEKFPELEILIHTGSVNYHPGKQLALFNITDDNVFHKPQIDLTKFIERIEKIFAVGE